MKIINIGILAHVDAGKTTLTESLLYASGAISEPGERRKRDNEDGTPCFGGGSVGITIQAAVTSFQWHRCKVNIVDTPGHMDFLAEVYRSLAVLDGAILVISAKDGVQAQTRILFHALRKMNFPPLSLSTRSTRLALICRAWFSLFGISSPPILSSSRRCRCPRK